MKVKYDTWVQNLSDWANDNNFSFKVVKNPSLGFRLDYLLIEIGLEIEKSGAVKISQSSVGTTVDVSVSYLKFDNHNKKIINFDLSLYQKDFFNRLFNKNLIKTGNLEFDKRFGVITNNTLLAKQLFTDSKVQAFFLGNQFLTFNIAQSLITMKSMNMKCYDKNEIQELFDMFIRILKLLTN